MCIFFCGCPGLWILKVWMIKCVSGICLIILENSTICSIATHTSNSLDQQNLMCDVPVADTKSVNTKIEGTNVPDFGKNQIRNWFLWISDLELKVEKLSKKVENFSSGWPRIWFFWLQRKMSFSFWKLYFRVVECPQTHKLSWNRFEHKIS